MASRDASNRDPEPPRFYPWRWWRRWLGQRSERAAAQFLRQLGYRILATNVADRRGELDLLALDGETLVVVEVRSTSSDHTDALTQTAATVDYRKQQQITAATTRFLAHRGLLGRITVRYDVLAIQWLPAARQPTIRHIQNAFEATGRFQFFT